MAQKLDLRDQFIEVLGFKDEATGTPITAATVQATVGREDRAGSFTPLAGVDPVSLAFIPTEGLYRGVLPLATVERLKRLTEYVVEVFVDGGPSKQLRERVRVVRTV